MGGSFAIGHNMEPKASNSNKALSGFRAISREDTHVEACMEGSGLNIFGNSPKLGVLVPFWGSL